MIEEIRLRKFTVVAVTAFGVILLLLGGVAGAFAFPSFFDDFSSGTLDNWEVLKGDWEVRDGELCQDQLANTYLLGQIAIKDLNTQDFIVEAKVKFVELIPNGWCYVGFAVRYADANSFYWIVLKQTADGNGQPNSDLEIILAKEFVRLSVVKLGFTGQLNTFYNLKIEVQGKTFKIYVNGELKIDSEDDTFSNSGRILLWAGRCKARYDDVIVINPIENVVPEPAPIVAILIFIVAVAAYVKFSKQKWLKFGELN